VKIRINFHAAALQRINFQLIFTLTQIRVKIRIDFHAAALQRINFELIFTLTQIGVKIRINFHAAALQRINFELMFTLTQIRVKIRINFHCLETRTRTLPEVFAFNLAVKSCLCLPLSLGMMERRQKMSQRAITQASASDLP